MKRSLLLTAAGAVLLVAGCAQEEPHQAHYLPVYSGEVNASRASISYTVQTIGPSDSSIAAAVRESLRRNAEIAPIVPNIQINANNGAIVLYGWVQSVEQKHQIGTIARDVTGVVAVTNRLVPLVDPTSRTPAMVDQTQSSNPLLNNSSANSANQANNTNGLDPTALPGGPNKLYQQNNSEQGGQIQIQNTNHNQLP